MVMFGGAVLLAHLAHKALTQATGASDTQPTIIFDHAYEIQ